MSAPITNEISQLGHLTKPELIQRLTSIQKEITQHSQKWNENKLDAGKILLQLREGVPHGEWEPQLKEICKAAGIGRSTAHRYMDLAEGKKLLTEKTTVHGYAIDEIKSALQKAVRLGDEHLAMQCAVELDLSGKTQWIWGRLHIFASEDVGMARLGLHREIEDLSAQWKHSHRKPTADSTRKDHHPDRLFLVHAVLLLVRVQKSRLVDHALITYYENQQPIDISNELKQADAVYDHSEPIEILDAALDEHTKRGQKLGRKGAAGINHFFDVGATLNNESPAIEDPYKESARQALLQKTSESTLASSSKQKTWIDYESNFLSADRQTQILDFINAQPLTPETGACNMPPTHDSIQWGPRQAYLHCVPAKFRITSSGPIPNELAELHYEIEQRYKAVFNTIQVNRHWNEKAVVQPHSDNMHGDIVMLSLGAPRRFVLRYKHDDKSQQQRWKAGDVYFDEVLPSGSLLTIYKQHQFDLTHEMPASDEPCGPRVSLIWRYIAKPVTKILGRQGLIDGFTEYKEAQSQFIEDAADRTGGVQ